MSPFGRLGKRDEWHGIRGKKITIGQDLLVREFPLTLETCINIYPAREITLVIDLAREMQPVKENISDVAHFNAQSARLVAARIAADLTPIIARLAKKPLSAN